MMKKYEKGKLCNIITIKCRICDKEYSSHDYIDLPCEWHETKYPTVFCGTLYPVGSRYFESMCDCGSMEWDIY